MSSSSPCSAAPVAGGPRAGGSTFAPAFRPAMSRAPVSAALLAGTLALAGSCHLPLPAAERRWRDERAQAVRAALPESQRATFGGLRFYRYDPAYRFRLVIEPLASPESVQIPASSGAIRPAHRLARVRLRFPAGTGELTLFQLDDLRESYPDHLFLPFRDAGAGGETYGAGRYVEVTRLSGGVVELDFNRAYNPDCAYGLAGACPITPQENTLAFSIPAGEMMPAGH
jgi:uncharacterized protein